MSDEQRRVARFLAQPEGLGLFSPSGVIIRSFSTLNLAHSALLGKKQLQQSRLD
ncbi:MAG: hypothetical protein KZQ93_13290 [Candidatus Thiodiazotropha sp. (ex Monitilora ramsayi)]|nr:hypothetical protein [Candidatus Thiodiazotropha sp. (ex Monitilora ramsayi)]